MQGGKLSRGLQLAWVLLALMLSIFRPSLAAKGPSLVELHALTDFARANGFESMRRGGKLSSWRFDWDAQGNWAGGNPCRGYRGMRCWSTGNLRKLSPPSATLQGPISLALGNLTNLNNLDLGGNQLSGDIAPVLARMSRMKTLRLQGNQFTGSLSQWVQNMPLLEELTLARNKLAGDIATGVFSNLSHLTIVDISNNTFLTGPIPDDLVSLPSLQELSLGGNNFTGIVPGKLTVSPVITSVDLSRNSLTGRLPTLWNMPNLTYLDLSGNNLSGPIPLELVNVSRTAVVNLSQNNFSGNVSSLLAKRFGCAAFAGNPGLIVHNCTTSTGSSGTSAATPPPAEDDDKKKSLSTFAIVALTVGNAALIFMSLVGCLLFWKWWRKEGTHNDDGGDDPKQWTAIASKGDHSSKAITVRSPGGNVVSAPAPTNSTRSSFAAKPDIKPALKSVVGMVRDPAKDNMTADVSLDDSISISDFGTKVAILDTTLALEFEDLLGAKALVLGAGSYGVVYMACLEDGEMLAIKRIEELALSDQMAFGKKCAQLAEVLHPNLLQLRAYCWSPQEKLLVFDYMRNGSVHALLHDGRSTPGEGKGIDWATRLKIAVGTARAVAHLHDSDMVHGNIKASNVLLDDHFEPRVADFGLETLLRTPPLQHHTDNGYLAPELRARAPRHGTQDGDVYSLGVFLLELLTGKEPVGTDSVDLPTWVQEMTLDNKKVQLFDPALTSMHILPAQDILEFLELAQACVSADAAARPSVTIVLRSLESIVPGSTAPRSYVKDDSIDSDASFRVPGSTATRSHVKDDSIDSDASFREPTGYYSSSPGFVKSVSDGVNYSDDDVSHINSFPPGFATPLKDDEYDDDSDASYTNPFLPGFIKPVRLKMVSKQKSRDGSVMGGSSVSSVGSFYSNLTTPSSSPSVSGDGVSTFNSTPLR